MAINYEEISSVETLERAFARVREAQKVFATYTQSQVDEIFKMAAMAANRARIPLAKMAVEETGIIEIMKSIITDIKPDHASFYIFYDKLQLVQSQTIPQYISDADCKLTLYRNCRNTENIATKFLILIIFKTSKIIS